MGGLRPLFPLGRGWNVNPQVDKWWLCFTAEQAGSTIKMERYGSGAPSISLETSVDDGGSWQSFTVNSTKITLSKVGDKVYFRAGPSGNARIAKNLSNENNFIMTGKISASGNLHSLLNANEIPSTIPTYCYAELFYNCKSLISAVVPDAVTFEKSCYINMFESCTGLKSVTVHFKSFLDASRTVNTDSWFRGTSGTSTGTFYCPVELGTQSTIQRDTSHCPNSWTVVNI